jgi:hypothetical protein
LFNNADALTGIQLGLSNNQPNFPPLAMGLQGAPGYGQIRGLQIGAINGGRDVRGVQLGFFNAAPTFGGFRLAAVNLGGDSNGVEASFLNLHPPEPGARASGVMIGLGNVAGGEMRGLQIGLVNLAGRLHGVQIGAINLNAQPRRRFLTAVPIVNAAF